MVAPIGAHHCNGSTVTTLVSYHRESFGRVGEAPDSLGTNFKQDNNSFGGPVWLTGHCKGDELTQNGWPRLLEAMRRLENPSTSAASLRFSPSWQCHNRLIPVPCGVESSTTQAAAQPMGTWEIPRLEHSKLHQLSQNLGPKSLW